MKRQRKKEDLIYLEEQFLEVKDSVEKSALASSKQALGF